MARTKRCKTRSRRTRKHRGGDGFGSPNANPSTNFGSNPNNDGMFNQAKEGANQILGSVKSTGSKIVEGTGSFFGKIGSFFTGNSNNLSQSQPITVGGKRRRRNKSKRRKIRGGSSVTPFNGDWSSHSKA